MSEENVEIVRQVFDAVSRRDEDAVFALYDPKVEFDSSGDPLTRLVGGGRVYHGHEGLRSFFRARSEALAEVEDSCEELIDAGENVISVGSVRARGRASGIEVELLDEWGVWTVRDGKIVRVVFFETRAEALEAAGLSEERP